MILKSLILGSFIGFLYGLFFVIQQRRVFFNGKKTLFTTLLFSNLRLIFFALSVFYILHLPSINLILVLISFILTTWYYIFSKGMHPYERC